MSRDFYRNRSALGSIPQMPSIPGSLQKLLDFTLSTDLTDNFNQTLGTGATQTVTGGVVQFRNSQYDKANHVESKFTLKFLEKVEYRVSYTAGSTSYWWPQIWMKVVDSAGAVVTSFDLLCDYNNSYSSDGWLYWNSGYVYWRLGTDANNSTAANAKRICSVPAAGYHVWEIIDNANGTFTVKIDGTTVGANISLGNSSYRLGSVLGVNPLAGWNNNGKYADLDYLYLTYKV